jgi:hypothetical protein
LRDGLCDFDKDDHSHLVIDNTFNTNYWGYKLTGIIGMRNTGRAYTFGLGFMCSETTAAFVWVLTAIVELAGKRPGIIISDGDKALAAAIVSVFGDKYAAFRHILCVWHLSKNVYDNVNYIFSNASRVKKGDGQGVKAWHVFIRTRIALVPHAQPNSTACMQPHMRAALATVRRSCYSTFVRLLPYAHAHPHSRRARRRLLAAGKAERRAVAAHV